MPRRRRTQFQADRNNQKLAGALYDKEFEKSVETLMSTPVFTEMCRKLGPEGLKKQAEGDGARLVESFDLQRNDRLQPYRPEAQPVVQNGPQINAVDQVHGPGPQPGGH